MFTCSYGACTGLSGSIPDTWAKLCNLSYFSLYDPANSTSQLTGRLPWKWMYKLSYQWQDEDIKSCFPDIVDIPSSIEFPRYVCLARGHPKITSVRSAKVYRRNDGEWAYISNSTGTDPEAEIADAIVSVWESRQILTSTHGSVNNGRTYSFDVQQSACTSTDRFTLIPVVYSVFGLVMLGAIVALFLPSSVLSYFVPVRPQYG